MALVAPFAGYEARTAGQYGYDQSDKSSQVNSRPEAKTGVAGFRDDKGNNTVTHIGGESVVGKSGDGGDILQGGATGKLALVTGTGSQGNAANVRQGAESKIGTEADVNVNKDMGRGAVDGGVKGANSSMTKTTAEEPANPGPLSTLGSFGSSALNGVKQFFSDKFNGAVQFIKDKVAGVGEFLGNGWNGLVDKAKGGALNLVNRVADGATNAINGVKDRVVNGVTNGVATLGNRVTNGVANLGNRVKDVVTNLGNRVTEGVANLGTKVTGGVTNVGNSLANRVTDGIANLANRLTNILGSLFDRAHR